MSRISFHVSCIMCLALLLVTLPFVYAQEPGLTETFNDPSLPGWEHSPGVTVVDGVLRIEPGNFAFHGGEWGDFTLTLRARFLPPEVGGDQEGAGVGAFVISYRVSDAGAYHLLVEGERLALQREAGGDVVGLAAAPATIPSGEWFQIGVTVAGGEQAVTLNGEPALTASDPDPLPPGGIAFETLGELTVEFDDLTLTPAGGEAVPPPRAATPTAESVPPTPGAAAPAEILPVDSLTWVWLGGPPGGLGYDIRMRPDNPDVMFVTDAHAGIHKSTDGGRTWFPVNEGIAPFGVADVPIFCATIDPHDYDTVWVGTQGTGRIYRSTDNGQSWELRDEGITHEGRSVRGITIDPNDPNVVYAGVEVSSFIWNGTPLSRRQDLVKGEVYKSTDRGLTWTRIWEGNNLARYVWVDPRNSQRIYVSTGIFDRDAADSDVPNKVWGGVGILRSDDGGQTWTVLDEQNGLGGRYIPSLFMHPTNPDILLAAVTGTADRPGVYVTRDGGDNWELVLDTHGLGAEAVEIATGDTNIWYAAGEGIIYRSDDAGQTWQSFPISTPNRDAGMPIDLQVDPRDSYRIFVNNYGGGNFLSEDGGETWVDASQGYTGIKLKGDLGVLPGNGATVFAAGFRSDDAGQTWVAIEPNDVQSFHFLPSDGALVKKMVFGDNDGHVWHSDDGGQTWQSVQVVDLMRGVAEGRFDADVQSQRALAVAPSDWQVMYTGFSVGACMDGVIEACQKASAGFYRSRDGGYTWEEVPDVPFAQAPILRIAVHPQNSQVLFAGTAQGLFRSQDGGQTWERVSDVKIDYSDTSLDPDILAASLQAPIVYDVVFDPSDPQTIYAASVPGAVWRSTDGGESWVQSAAGMDPNEKVYTIVPDPNRPGVLYASSELSGVFMTTDSAQTWRRISDGLTNRNVHGLALSSDGSVLYAGTIGSGVYRLDLTGQPPQPLPGATPTPVAATPMPAPETSGEPAYRSTSWVYLGGPLGGLGYDVRMRPDNPDVMFVTDAWAGVFKSTDGGATWFPSNSGITTRVGPSGDGIPVFSLTIDPNNPDRVWIGTQYSRSVYRSDDGGVTWVQMNNGIQERAPTIRGFTVEPGNSDVVYLAGEVSSWEWNGTPLPGLGLDMVKGIVYKTTDGGQHWERIWYGDNLARYVWIHPQNHDLIYVSTGIFDREAANSDPVALKPGGVGILRSRDGGQTWEVLGVENGFRADELYFGSLYMHPTNPNVLLAAAGNDPYMHALGRPIGAVYRTEDGGDSWQRVLDLPNGSAVEICEGDPNVAYAASLNGFFRSDDGGRTWQLQTGVGAGEVVQAGEEMWGPPGVVAGFPIDLQCDPRNADRVFVNAYGGGNFVSEDGGKTWHVASSGYSGALMAQIAVARDDPARVYATARSGVFASADGGQTWEGLSYGPARAMEAIAIAVDPQDSQHILTSVGDAGPLPKLSTDGGHTWRDVGMELQRAGVEGMITRVRFSPADPQLVLASVGNGDCVLSGECEDEPGHGIVVSRDGGETWQWTDLESGHVLNLAFSADGNRVYATVYPARVYRSDDGGQTWTMVSPDAGVSMPPPSDPDMPRSALTALAVDPTNPDKVYVGFIRGGIAVSHDGGATWQPASSGMPPEVSVKAIVVDPTNPDVVYAGALESGVFLSTDGGQTWRELNAGLLTRAVRDLALSADGRVLYMASEGGGAFRLGTPPRPQPAPTATPLAATPTPKPTATPVPAAPTPPSEVSEPEEGAPKGGICGGAAALPLALVGLAWGRRRR